jgi:hypothetical protein
VCESKKRERWGRERERDKQSWFLAYFKLYIIWREGLRRGESEVKVGCIMIYYSLPNTFLDLNK